MQISVDFSRTVGPIKPVHGVGEPPYYGSSLSLLPYLKQAGIPYARLHDIGMSGYSRKWVDIHHIFPDFSADPTDPASYDFTFTDCLINESCTPIATYKNTTFAELYDTIRRTVKEFK